METKPHLLVFLSQNEQFQCFPINIQWRGHVTDLTTADSLKNKFQMQKYEYPGSLLPPKDDSS